MVARYQTKVGILGMGPRSMAIATRLADAGVEMAVCNEDEAAAVDLSQLGIRLSSCAHVVEQEIVILAVSWWNLPAAVRRVADWEGRIVIDTTDPLGPDGSAIDMGGTSSSERVASMVEGAYVVKAFNTLPAALLAESPRLMGGRRVLFVSGDHQRVKREVVRLIDHLGFAPIDLGSLREGGRFQQGPDGPLHAVDLVRRDARPDRQAI